MSKLAISVIAQDEVAEIQWGREEPANGRIDGYLLVHENGTITIPFRDSEDMPFVFLLGAGHAAIIVGEDQCDRVTAGDKIDWITDM